MSVATLVVFIVGTTVAVLTAVAAATRWVGRHWFADEFDRGLERAMDPDHGPIGRQFAAAAHKLDSVDRAVNQTTGETLTRRVDELATNQKHLIASFDEARGEWRTWRDSTLTRGELTAVAAVLHPDIDPDDIAEMIGNRPPLTVEQAREIARRRVRDDGPDNPEEHPR